MQMIEVAAASLVTYSPLIWQLSRFKGGFTYEAIYHSMRALRSPPLAPSRLGLRLGAPGVHVSRGASAAAAVTLYESVLVEAFNTFRITCPGRAQLVYTDAGWTAEAAPVLAEALRFAASRVALPAGVFLTVHVKQGNSLGAEGFQTVKEAIRGSPFKIK